MSICWVNLCMPSHLSYQKRKKENHIHFLSVCFFVPIIKAARWVFPPQLHNIKLICVSLSSRLKAPPIARDGTFFWTDCLESTSGQHASFFFPSELDVHPGLLVCNHRVKRQSCLFVALCNVRTHIRMLQRFPCAP